LDQVDFAPGTDRSVVAVYTPLFDVGALDPIWTPARSLPNDLLSQFLAVMLDDLALAAFGRPLPPVQVTR
jgi:hypothetical protein